MANENKALEIVCKKDITMWDVSFGCLLVPEYKMVFFDQEIIEGECFEIKEVKELENAIN